MKTQPEELIDVYDDITPFVYIFVRKDLEPIDQAIQLGHALWELGKIHNNEHKTTIPDHFCVLGVTHLELVKLPQTIPDDIDFNLFWEPDRDIGYSALATVPIIGERRKLFSKYDLLKMKKKWF